MVTRMCSLQKHGGPDDEGMYADEETKLVLGHRRLALIDLSPGGHQPKSYDAGRYVISYNGELYNYLEIKAELVKAGYHFESASDTEVILASFAAWGTHAFKRFNGMFALALWDAQQKDLYLVRDASGIKPLYYAVTTEGLAFASEVRALKSLPWLQEENKQWPVFLLAYGHLPEPITTLQQVKPLPKGCFLRYRANDATWDIESFAFYSYTSEPGSREERIAQVRDCLQKAVQRHLISDAPIGVFLSGGIDSGIMALLAARYHKGEQLKTLSIDFGEKQFSEKKYQDLLLNKLNCSNWQGVLTRQEFQKHFPDIIAAMDLPGCDGINTWFISKYAKESGLKAVLSGLGGDELFGGYPSFKRMERVNMLEQAPRFLLRAGRYFGSKKLQRLTNLSFGNTRGAYLFLRGQFIPAAIAKQIDASEDEVWQVLDSSPAFDDIHNLVPANQASWLEMNMYMQNQLLRDADVMSMAHGIEIRVPFLDKEFMNLVLGIKAEIKYAGHIPKQLLIDAFKDELPEPVWNRPKMGFTFPFAQWMAENELVHDSMSAMGSRGEDNYKKFAKGQMHWSQLMSLILMQQYREAA